MASRGTSIYAARADHIHGFTGSATFSGSDLYINNVYLDQANKDIRLYRSGTADLVISGSNDIILSGSAGDVQLRGMGQVIGNVASIGWYDTANNIQRILSVDEYSNFVIRAGSPGLNNNSMQYVSFDMLYSGSGGTGSQIWRIWDEAPGDSAYPSVLPVGSGSWPSKTNTWDIVDVYRDYAHASNTNLNTIVLLSSAKAESSTGKTTRNSPILYLEGHYWSGSNARRRISLQEEVTNATGSRFVVKIGDENKEIERFRLLDSGSLKLIPTGSFPSGLSYFHISRDDLSEGWVAQEPIFWVMHDGSIDMQHSQVRGPIHSYQFKDIRSNGDGIAYTPYLDLAEKVSSWTMGTRVIGTGDVTSVANTNGWNYFNYWSWVKEAVGASRTDANAETCGYLEVARLDKRGILTTAGGYSADKTDTSLITGSLQRPDRVGNYGDQVLIYGKSRRYDDAYDPQTANMIEIESSGSKLFVVGQRGNTSIYNYSGSAVALYVSGSSTNTDLMFEIVTGSKSIAKIDILGGISGSSLLTGGNNASNSIPLWIITPSGQTAALAEFSSGSVSKAKVEVDGVYSGSGILISRSATSTSNMIECVTGSFTGFQVDKEGNISGSGITARSNIYPSSNNAVDIGLTDLQFRNEYLTGSLYVTGSLTVGSTIAPNTNNADDLGTSTLQFKDAYFTGSLYVSGSSRFGNPVIIMGKDNTAVPLYLNSPSAQTDDLAQFLTGSRRLAAVDRTGGISGSNLQIGNINGTVTPLYIKAPSTQTTFLAEFLTGSTTLATISQSGSLKLYPSSGSDGSKYIFISRNDLSESWAAQEPIFWVSQDSTGGIDMSHLQTRGPIHSYQHKDIRSSGDGVAYTPYLDLAEKVSSWTNGIRVIGSGLATSVSDTNAWDYLMYWSWVKEANGATRTDPNAETCGYLEVMRLDKRGILSTAGGLVADKADTSMITGSLTRPARVENFGDQVPLYIRSRRYDDGNDPQIANMVEIESSGSSLFRIQPKGNITSNFYDSTSVGLYLSGSPSQTVNMIECVTGSKQVFWVGKEGGISGSNLTVRVTGSNTVPLTAYGVTGQTANLMELYSGNIKVFSISSTGVPSGSTTVLAGGASSIDQASFALIGHTGTGTSLMPYSGRLSDFYIKLGTAPGVGNARTFYIYKNGGATGITISISGTATTGNNTTNVVYFDAGDSVYIGEDYIEGSAASTASWGIKYTST